MRKLLQVRCPIVLIGTACSTLYAQQQVDTDSILNRLTRLGEDSNKAFAYDRLANLYNFVQFNASLIRKYADSAIRLSEKLNCQSALNSSHDSYGMIDMNERHDNEAMEHFDTHINLHTKADASLQFIRIKGIETGPGHTGGDQYSHFIIS